MLVDFEEVVLNRLSYLSAWDLRPLRISFKAVCEFEIFSQFPRKGEESDGL